MNDSEEDALDKGNTTKIEKIQEEIKSFHKSKIPVQKIARIEKSVKSNIFLTDSNGTTNEDEITPSYIINI